ncbi:hypothetical protein EYF80_034302 [Liparis tanakae]|uniref:Uncharacterized protein n=1 Tax=Liparis tanakae TaxID=230148 RepID=A0A4Z2GQG4_9TELE|nr:hypothetical protein EYF80_034302 [Liparis tanakae]
MVPLDSVTAPATAPGSGPANRCSAAEKKKSTICGNIGFGQAKVKNLLVVPDAITFTRDKTQCAPQHRENVGTRQNLSSCSFAYELIGCRGLWTTDFYSFGANPFGRNHIYISLSSHDVNTLQWAGVGEELGIVNHTAGLRGSDQSSKSQQHRGAARNCQEPTVSLRCADKGGESMWKKGENDARLIAVEAHLDP